MNETEKEQWERFLGRLDFYRSWSPSENVTVVRKTKLKGNEYTYEQLLNIPCFTMGRGRDKHGEYFDGWFSKTQINVARIIWPNNSVKNYLNDEKGRKGFLRDFCDLVMSEKESEVDYVILELEFLPEFVKQVNEAVVNREKESL